MTDARTLIEELAVAWRIKDYADGWLYSGSSDLLKLYSRQGHLIEPLYSAAYVRQLEAERDELRKALEPFNNEWADENGWTESACQNDRICDWIGPSDFSRARLALNATREDGE